MQQYYGPAEVLSKVEKDGFVTITLKREEGENNYELKVPTATFELIVTPEATDWNYVQEKKFEATVGDVLEILMKKGITGGEFKSFLQVLTLSYYNVLDRAISYQFMGDDESFVPGGSDIYFDFTLERAHEITKHLDDTNNTGTSTAA